MKSYLLFLWGEIMCFNIVRLSKLRLLWDGRAAQVREAENICVIFSWRSEKNLEHLKRVPVHKFML